MLPRNSTIGQSLLMHLVRAAHVISDLVHLLHVVLPGGQTGLRNSLWCQGPWFMKSAQCCKLLLTDISVVSKQIHSFVIAHQRMYSSTSSSRLPLTTHKSQTPTGQACTILGDVRKLSTGLTQYLEPFEQLHKLDAAGTTVK